MVYWIDQFLVDDFLSISSFYDLRIKSFCMVFHPLRFLGIFFTQIPFSDLCFLLIPVFQLGCPSLSGLGFPSQFPFSRFIFLEVSKGLYRFFQKRFCFSLFSVFSEMFFPLNYQDFRGVIQSRQDLSNICDTRLSSRISFQVPFLLLSKSGFHSIPVQGRWSLRAQGLIIRSC